MPAARSSAEPFGPPVALVANLPYAVAATVVLRFFEELPSLRYRDRDGAGRGGRPHGGRTRARKDYGSYTVKLRLLRRPAGRFAVARACFLPPPRVDSAVLRLERAPLLRRSRDLSG